MKKIRGNILGIILVFVGTFLYGVTVSAENISFNPRFDLNNDQKIDVLDIRIVSSRYGATQGTARYNAKVDVDGNKKIDTNDSRSIRNAYINQSLVADITRDGVINVEDVKLMLPAMGTTAGASKYSVVADIDSNNKVDIDDVRIIRNAYSNKSLISDLTGDGKINIYDVKVVAMSFGSNAGTSKYNAVADIDSNNTVNSDDVRIVRNAYINRGLIADLSGNEVVNITDLQHVAKSFGATAGTQNYSVLADIDSNNVVDINDARFIRSNFTKSNTVFDVNGDGVRNITDIKYIGKFLGATAGTQNYSLYADVDSNSVVDSNDAKLVRERYSDPTLIGDVSGNGIVNQADITLVQPYLNFRYGQSNYKIAADLNGDNVVDNKDVDIIRNAIK